MNFDNVRYWDGRNLKPFRVKNYIYSSFRLCFKINHYNQIFKKDLIFNYLEKENFYKLKKLNKISNKSKEKMLNLGKLVKVNEKINLSLFILFILLNRMESVLIFKGYIII